MGQKQAHVLVVAFPLQGHVKPLMKLAQKISDQGIKVTFVHTEFIHAIISAAVPNKYKGKQQLELVSIPDGLEPGNDRKDIPKLMDSVEAVMPGHLVALIQKINSSGNDQKITCLLSDVVLGGRILKVGEEMGIAKVAISPAGSGTLALVYKILKLIEAGVLDSNGCRVKNEPITLSDGIPSWKCDEIPWRCPNEPEAEKRFFRSQLKIQRSAENADWLLCNTFYELDSHGCDLIPNILPIGPLLLSDQLDQSAGSFLREDASCLTWLDEQPPNSVIYVAFGSSGVFTHDQFSELAMGLELSGRPFLWVVRSDFIKHPLSSVLYPDGFLERVANWGKIVAWAPQETVLAHPSIACFMSHCGWNSILDGLSMGGVPFLCWPYLGDQPHNSSYICDIWRVGLRVGPPDKNGTISRLEIKSKIENLLSDAGIKENAKRLKKMAQESVSPGGSSFKNFERFIKHLKMEANLGC